MKKVLVTGSSGYLGSWIVRTLLESGYEVRAAVRSEEKYTLLESSLLSENVPIHRPRAQPPAQLVEWGSPPGARPLRFRLKAV